MNEALAIGLSVLTLPLVVACAWLGALALLSRPGPAPTAPAPRHRFDLVVPAHDEALGIANTVTSLLAIDYPAELRRVVVVADNCSDDTAARARAAGATVLERTDTERRGKGFALAHAFAWSAKDSFQAHACCVIDADTVVSKNLLSAFSARLAAGATAMQAHYGVSNPLASWRTRLMRIALAMFHQVRSTARERLGVSCGLRGNGMCFSRALLEEVPHDAFSLVEDLEYGIRIGKAGHRVVWVGEADVLGEMVAGEQASRSQRRRWEHGRAEMMRLHGWPLLAEALRRRSGLLLDLALDVLVPPLSRLALGVVAGVAAVVALAAFAPSALVALPAATVSLSALGLSLYVTAGWLHSRTGLRGLVDLAMAPAYVAWKVALAFQGRASQKPQGWVRTTREGETK
ncbi:MAG: glycosyltransferase [Myxococcaceae bacterium]|nr:glycosyltransferase [Myxococcaceae bacterium]